MPKQSIFYISHFLKRLDSILLIKKHLVLSIPHLVLAELHPVVKLCPHIKQSYLFMAAGCQGAYE